ncbi:hypothetical protein CH063_06033 [Colletotrichum higginsianum]|uniref:Uncharacterized protein n=1 Tax=Colletotrichum higginsianum (strain IMI 349063) TaxID=759273 RepID=H1V139_COLHI|nr:hypothetical protein CH063_06033 [Colletotrichum higginsianum]
MTDDIRFDVECLLDLESLIKSPFIDPPKRKSVELEWSYNAPTPHQPYLERISRRFPLAKQDLVDRLAKACWKRFQRIQIDKHRNSGLEERETKDGVSEFYDSGLGTSLGMTTSYAETVMSYRQNSGKSMSTRIPPLPAEAKKGDPFERHLFDDLRPWMCHDASCQYGNEPFSSKEDWAQHLALQHGFQSDWHSLDCPFCLESTGDGKTAILKHLATHFEEISLSSLPPGVDSDSDSGGGVSHATAEVSEKSLQDATGQFDGSIRYISNFELEWRADTDVTPKSGLDQVYHKTEQSPTNSRASSAGDEERERERQKAQERLQRIRERIAKQNDEISRRTAIPFKRTSTGFSPSLADQQREQEHVDAIRRLEIADRQAQEAREARKQEKEDKAQRHQLMERMMPQRQATVRPGSRRHRVLHNDGDERVRVKAKGSHSKATT